MHANNPKPLHGPHLQLIPEEYEYSSDNGDSFVAVDATTQIKEGTEVRIKIVGVRVDPGDMVRGSEQSLGCFECINLHIW